MLAFNQLFDAHRRWVETSGASGKPLSLDGIDMRRVSLNAPVLEQAFFTDCDFRGMAFENVDFYRSEFYSCDFSHSVFIDCDFSKCALDYSSFTGSRFYRCKFPHADAFRADFDECIFQHCSLAGINLMECSLAKARIEETDFEEAYLDKIRASDAAIICPSNIEKINRISLLHKDGKTITEGAAALKMLKKES